MAGLEQLVAEFLEAAYIGDLEFIVEMLNQGMPASAADKEGWTALHWAAQEGHADIVKTLLQHGADVNAASNKAMTPMDLTVSRGNYRVVSILLAHGADPNTRLGKVIEDGRADIVQALLQAGADPNGPARGARTSAPFRAVQIASASQTVQSRNIETVKVLLRHGADVQATMTDGATPADQPTTPEIAMLLAQESIVRALRQRGRGGAKMG